MIFHIRKVLVFLIALTVGFRTVTIHGLPFMEIFLVLYVSILIVGVLKYKQINKVNNFSLLVFFFLFVLVSILINNLPMNIWMLSLVKLIVCYMLFIVFSLINSSELHYFKIGILLNLILTMILSLPMIITIINTGYSNIHLRGSLTSTFVDPNYFATYLILPLTISCQQFFYSRKPILKLLNCMLIILATFLILITLSRGTILSIIVGLVFISMINALLKNHKINIKSTALITIIGILVVNLIYKLYPYVIENIIDRMKVAKLESGSGRNYLFEVAIDVFKDSPIFGIGLENFKNVFVHFSFFTPNVQHNLFLQVLTESGVFALIIFLFFIGKLFLKSIKIKDEKWIYYAFVFMVINSLTLNMLTVRYLWVIFGLVNNSVLKNKNSERC